MDTHRYPAGYRPGPVAGSHAEIGRLLANLEQRLVELDRLRREIAEDAQALAHAAAVTPEGRDGARPAVAGRGRSSGPDPLPHPVLRRAVRPAGDGELGRIRDPRCADALALLESKLLPDDGFPLEEANAATADRVASRHSYAEWGLSGRRQSKPLVSLTALGVLRADRP